MKLRNALAAAMAAATLLALLAPGAIASPAEAAPAPGDVPAGWHVVERAGITVTVPDAWETVDLAADPSACLRLDTSAAYLGIPGGDQRCEGRAVGRAPSVQVLSAAEATAQLERSPEARATTIAGDPVATDLAAPDGRHVVIRYAQPSDLTDQIAASVVFGTAPPVDLTPAPLPPVPTDGTGSGSTRSTRAVRKAEDGFETCEAPSPTVMSAWARSSPYSTVGIYIGGVNRGCAQALLTKSWVAQQAASGWSFIPTYVGRQAPCTRPSWAKITASSATSQGTAAAKDAVAQATALGLGSGTAIYLDMEEFDVRQTSCTNAVMAYFSAWTVELHRQRFVSGVYGSASSAISAMGQRYSSTSFTRPDEVWIARWNGVRSDAEATLTASQWAGHRIHQYRGDHAETYGGYRLSIDNDFVNTAALRRSTEPAAGNLLANRSWEDTTDSKSWAPIVGDAATLTTATGTPGAHDGTRWARASAPTGAGTSFAQAIAVPARSGERWAFTAWVRSPSGTPVTGRLAIDGIGGSAPAGGSATFSAGSTWTPVTAWFSPYASFTSVRAAVTLTTPDVTLDVDDASVLRSPGYAPFSSWDGFVARQAADFTGSSGSLSTRASAVGQLAAGTLSPTAHIQRQMRSTWFEPHVAPVTRLYWAYFGRIPDAGGVRFWASHHRAGTQLATISQQFAISSEFTRKTGGLTDRDFVARLYTDVLGRPADPSGLAYWTGQLTAKRRTRGDVMVQFSESDEYRRAMAPAANTYLTYFGMLQRSPTTDELTLGAAQPTYLVIDGIRRGSAYAARVR